MRDNESSDESGRSTDRLNRTVADYFLNRFDASGLNLRRNTDAESRIILRNLLEIKLISTLASDEWRNWLPVGVTLEKGIIRGENCSLRVGTKERYSPYFLTYGGKILSGSNSNCSGAFLTELYCLLHPEKHPNVALQELAQQFGIHGDSFDNSFPTFTASAINTFPFDFSSKDGAQMVLPVRQVEIPSPSYKGRFYLYSNKVGSAFTYSERIKNSPNNTIVVLTDSPLLIARNSSPIALGEEYKLYISSWYGEDSGAKDVDWRPLKGTRVYYLLIQHSQSPAQELFRTALTVCEALKLQGTDVTIISYFEGVNSTYYPAFRSEPMFIEYEDFKPIAETIINSSVVKNSIFEFPHQSSAFLLIPAIKECSVSLFYGDPLSNKTLFILSLALAVSQGIPAFENWFAAQPAKVLYIHGEDTGNEIKEKLKVLSKVYEHRLDTIYCWPVPNTPKLSLDFVCKAIYARFQELRSQGHIIPLLVLDNLSCLEQMYSPNSELVLLQEWLNKFQSEGLAVWLVPPRRILTSKSMVAIKRLGLDNIFKVNKSDSSLLNTLTMEICIERCPSLPKLFRRNFKLRIDFNANKPHWHLFSGTPDEQLKQTIERLTKEKYTEKQIAEYLAIPLALLKKRKRDFEILRFPKKSSKTKSDQGKKVKTDKMIVNSPGPAPAFNPQSFAFGNSVKPPKK